MAQHTPLDQQEWIQLRHLTQNSIKEIYSLTHVSLLHILSDCCIELTQYFIFEWEN